jgi:hypothetical protein
MRKVRLTQIDGKLPNLALMKLAHWHCVRGDEVYFTKHIERELFEHDYDCVYGSAIFSFSRERVERFKAEFPDAIVGGTHDLTDNRTVEQLIGEQDYEYYDYSIYPNFEASIGFTQRGCRLKCGFCVVPKKEGKNRSVNTIADIWRGESYPRHLHLLDNDFFGQPPEQWQLRVKEIIDGNFKVCLNQGINVRMIDEQSAEAIGAIKHYNDTFDERIVYTAWDNIGDEQRFFRGVDLLEKYGTPAFRLRVYMLIGYDPRETWERVLYRFGRMIERQIRPYPMIYGERSRTLPLGNCNQRIAHRTLGEFQRWVIRRAYTIIPFENYDVSAKGHLITGQLELQEMTPIETIDNSSKAEA